jgi:hypothetical protein
MYPHVKYGIFQVYVVCGFHFNFFGLKINHMHLQIGSDFYAN